MSRSRGDSGRKRGRGRGRAIVLDNEASIPNRGRARGRLGRISLEDEQIGHVQQERLEEENEQRNGPVAEEELLVTTEESEAAETESKAPPGKQIPLFTVNTYPTWRKKFFTDWREEGNTVWALCKICNNGHYFSGGKSSFTNFNTHVKLTHVKDYSELSTAQSKIDTFATPTKVHTTRQHQLDEGLTRTVTEDNLPLNLLTRKAFRSWIKVMIFPLYMTITRNSN